MQTLGGLSNEMPHSRNNCFQSNYKFNQSAAFKGAHNSQCVVGVPTYANMK